MIFAISMDYTVFLLSAAKEHWDHTHDPKQAMVGGLAHSGRVIFTAGGVMVAVFFTFALSGPLPPKEMGVILGVAVLLDAALIRLLLLPVLLTTDATPGICRSGCTGSCPPSPSGTARRSSVKQMRTMMLELWQTEWCPASQRVPQRLTELGLPLLARPFRSRGYELGDFGMGGMHLKRAGYVTPSSIFNASLFSERGYRPDHRVHINEVQPDRARYELLMAPTSRSSPNAPAPIQRRRPDRDRPCGHRHHRADVHAERLHAC